MRSVIGESMSGLRLFSALAIWAIAIWGLFGFDPSSVELGYWMKSLAVSFFVSAVLLVASAKWRDSRGRSPWPADRWSLVMIVLAAVFMNPFPKPEEGSGEHDWSIVISSVAPFVLMHLANSWPLHKSMAKRLIRTSQWATGLALLWPLAAILVMSFGVQPSTLKTTSSGLLLVPMIIMGVRRKKAQLRERRVTAAVVAMFAASVSVMIIYSFIEPGPLLAPLLVYLPLHSVAIGMAVCYGRFST